MAYVLTYRKTDSNYNAAVVNFMSHEWRFNVTPRTAALSPPQRPKLAILFDFEYAADMRRAPSDGSLGAQHPCTCTQDSTDLGAIDLAFDQQQQCN